MKWNFQTRAACLVMAFAFVFTAFSWRLIHLQVARHHHYVEKAAGHHLRKEAIHAQRGAIFDARGEVLAQNLPVRTIAVDGWLLHQLEQVDPVIELLATHLEMPLEEVRERADTERRYVILKREVPEATANALKSDLREQGLRRGVRFDVDSVRIYPNGKMLSHVLGFLNFERQGVLGVERAFNDYLKGRDGYRWVEKDRTGRELVPYRGLEKAAEDGLNIHLTIDMGLQMIVENEIQAAFEHYQPRSVTVVLADPNTGEVLAMSNRPHFDPNSPGDADVNDTKNRAILDMVEPGSTFKIVVASGALNEEIVRPESLVFCENGRFHYAGHVLKDHRPYGMLSVMDIIVKSSNIGSAKLAMMMGETKYYEYIRRFGFGDRTGVELPGEIGGLVHPPNKWDKLSITRIPMGHAIAATPMQLVMAMSAVANGGELMLPRVVNQTTDSQGETVMRTSPAAIRRVVSEESAAIVRRALEDVTGPRGTAKLARVDGYRVAGKTGTAQRVAPEGGYEEGKYVVSFLGYAPAENPRLTCIVMVDDASTPHGSNYGGTVAAPVFSKVVGQALRYLDVPPSLPLQTEEGKMANTRRSP